MSQNNGSGDHNGLKRARDPVTAAGDEKRVKTELATTIPDDDPSLAGVFDPLPFETKSNDDNLDFPMEPGSSLELPDFLSDKPHQNHFSSEDQSSTQHSHLATTSQQIASSKYEVPSLGDGRITSGEQTVSSHSGPIDHSRLPNNQARSLPNVPRVNSSPKLVNLPTGSALATSSNLYHSQSTLSLNTTYARTGPPHPSTGRPLPNSVAPFKASMRFDPSKSYQAPSSHINSPSPSVSGYGFPTALSGSNIANNTTANADRNKVEDPSKLNDALAAAGVDIQREEELLSTNYTRLPLNPLQQQILQRQRQGYGQSTPFLQPYHLALFMNRVGRENGMAQNFMVDTEMLEFMSSACKDWISNLVSKTVTIARHRRRGIPALSSSSGSSGTSGRQKFVPTSQRSEVSKDLREIALRQKTMEERRVEKRALLGLERSGEVAPETSGKDGNDETLHRAANATAAMMTMNPGRKKYSWMTSGAAASPAEDFKATPGKESGAKQSHLILLRGDNGLRFREIRTGNMITTRDLLSVLEDERIGTSKAIVKGYARLKD